jgi:hypothetical protein
MKNAIARLLGVNIPDTATTLKVAEILDRVGLNANTRLRLIREALNLPPGKRGRKRKPGAKSPKEANHSRYHRLKAEGRCVVCAKPNPTPHRVRCPDCKP